MLFPVAFYKKEKTKSNSTGAQYVTVQKYFSHPSFSYLLFSNPPLKLKVRLQIDGRQLIATHLDQ